MKEIKDYLHLYLGCPISFWNDVTEEWGNWRKMTASDIRIAFLGWAKYKIQLRSLNSMTEGESKELLLFTQIGGIIEIGSVVIKSNWNDAAYLLSKHFDLFNLIEEGLAIDAKTLNPDK